MFDKFCFGRQNTETKRSRQLVEIYLPQKCSSSEHFSMLVELTNTLQGVVVCEGTLKGYRHFEHKERRIAYEHQGRNIVALFRERRYPTMGPTNEWEADSGWYTTPYIAGAGVFEDTPYFFRVELNDSTCLVVRKVNESWQPDSFIERVSENK